uniref:LITAF domain-containing protein n=1 Tax=Steinernema glaseri TaxID=37863 RepID=A0A1I7Z3L7_9BILA
MSGPQEQPSNQAPMASAPPPPPGFIDRPIFSPPPPYTPPGAKISGPVASYYNSTGVTVNPCHHKHIEPPCFCCSPNGRRHYSAFCIVLLFMTLFIAFLHYHAPNHVEIPPMPPMPPPYDHQKDDLWECFNFKGTREERSRKTSWAVFSIILFCVTTFIGLRFFLRYLH